MGGAREPRKSTVPDPRKASPRLAAGPHVPDGTDRTRPKSDRSLRPLEQPEVKAFVTRGEGGFYRVTGAPFDLDLRPHWDARRLAELATRARKLMGSLQAPARADGASGTYPVPSVQWFIDFHRLAADLLEHRHVRPRPGLPVMPEDRKVGALMCFLGARLSVTLPQGWMAEFPSELREVVRLDRLAGGEPVEWRDDGTPDLLPDEPAELRIAKGWTGPERQELAKACRWGLGSWQIGSRAAQNATRWRTALANELIALGFPPDDPTKDSEPILAARYWLEETVHRLHGLTLQLLGPGTASGTDPFPP